MRWHGFSGFKYYASAAIALVGLSAASTLLTDRVSLAQQPAFETTVKVSDDDATEKLELVEKVLAETLGNDHPKLQEVRARLEQSRVKLEAQKATMEARKAAMAASKADAKRVIVQNFSGSPLTVTDTASTDAEVITENVVGGQTVVVRKTADGKEVHEVLAVNGPTAVRGFSLLGNPKQNSELQKAMEKYKDKEASESDKAAAKEKIVSILGQQFDDDMKQRSTQVAELEKKVATLKEQIEKRKGAKTRMIDLRLEMLMNESEGLGFPSSWQQPAGVGPLGATFGPSTESRTVVRALGVPAGTIPPLAPLPPVPPVAPVAPVAPVPEK